MLFDTKKEVDDIENQITQMKMIGMVDDDIMGVIGHDVAKFYFKNQGQSTAVIDGEIQINIEEEKKDMGDPKFAADLKMLGLNDAQIREQKQILDEMSIKHHEPKPFD